MEDQNANNMHTVFSVLSLIIGILGFIFCFIPCFGAYAIYAGIAGTVCGIIGVNMSQKAKAGIGMAVAGIVLSVLAGLIALWQINTLGNL
ncbi:MAG: hypothetical protein WCR71_05665 [Bacteroidales bacterium]